MRLQTRFRPGTVVLVLCALLFAAAPLTGAYFIDEFDDGNPLTVTGYDPWTLAGFTHGKYDTSTYMVVRESGGGLHIVGTNPAANEPLKAAGITRGPFSATAANPFGAAIRISAAQLTAQNNGPLSYLELTIAKSATEYASIVLHRWSSTSPYTIGYAWRDAMTIAPVALVYETEQYLTNSVGAFSGPVTLQLTHNGSDVRFFVNGSEIPADGDAYYAVTKAVVSWTNFNVYVSGAIKGGLSAVNASTIDWFMLRSSVSGTTASVSEIVPKMVTTGSAITFTNFILPAFDAATDSGIDSIVLKLPSGYSGLTINGVYSDSDDNGTLNTLTLGGASPGANEYYVVSNNGTQAEIRLGTRIGYDTDNKQIRVVFTATTPSASSFYGNDIQTTVESKYAGGTANSTTGPTLLVSGNAEGTVDSDTITVAVFALPEVQVAIDPYTIGLDAVNTTFNYNVRNATPVGNQGVTKLKVTIPAGFTIQGVSSLILNATEQATAVQVAGQVITVDYGAVGRNIPAGGGTDVISFTLTDDWNAAGGPYMFTSQVDDAVAPAGWINTTVQSGNTNGLMITEVQAQASAYIKPNSIYTSATNTDFTFYLVNNASGGNAITWARITLPAGFFVDNLADISSSVIGSTTGISISGGNVITLSYSNTGKNIPTSSMDIISLKVRDTITEPTYGRKWSAIVDNGADFKPAAQDAGLSVDAVISPYGGVIGKIFPLDVISSVTLYTNGTTISAGQATTDGTTGFYQISGLLPGSYDVYAIGPGYAGAVYMQNVIVTSNQNTAVANIYMNQNALNSEDQAVQTRKFIDDPLTKIDFPAGSLNNDTFFTVAEITTLTAAQLAALQNDPAIANPTNGSPVFDVMTNSIQSASGQTLGNLGLKKDATVVIHYDEVAILANGWTETSLAIYYWDGLHWIKIGGEVDTVNNNVTAKVRNIARIYAVFGVASPVTGGGDIRDVKASPNPFTPGQFGFDTATISFTLNPAKTFTWVDVKIFNLQGRKVRSYKVDGTSSNGAVPWDGKDNDGYYVKSGIYIYQITAGGSTYSGKIVMIR